MLGASSRSAGASMRSAGALVSVPRVWSILLVRLASSTPPSPRNSASALSHTVSRRTRCTLSCSEVENSSCARRNQRYSTKFGEVLAEGRPVLRPSNAARSTPPASQRRLCTKKYDLGCICTCTPTLGGPRLIAWSQPSSHWQHRQRPRRTPISHVRSAPPTNLGAALCRRGDAPVDATLETALCSWGAKVRRRPHAVDATSK